MIIRKTILLSVLVACGVTTVVAAATPSAVTPPAEQAKHFHHGEVLRNAPFMRAIHQLNLSADQLATIKNYEEAVRLQAKTNAASSLDVNALANPGDPSYAAAIATAKIVAVNRIQKLSDLELQIYGVLSSDQQARLPQVLADMKANHTQHRANEHHAQTPTATG